MHGREPPPGRQCSSKFSQCGGDHATDDRTCPERYEKSRVPRRARKQKQQLRPRQLKQTAPRKRGTRSLLGADRSSSTSRRRGAGRSRSTSRQPSWRSKSVSKQRKRKLAPPDERKQRGASLTRKQPQVSWAERLSSSPPPHSFTKNQTPPQNVDIKTALKSIQASLHDFTEIAETLRTHGTHRKATRTRRGNTALRVGTHDTRTCECGNEPREKD